MQGTKLRQMDFPILIIICVISSLSGDKIYGFPFSYLYFLYRNYRFLTSHHDKEFTFFDHMPVKFQHGPYVGVLFNRKFFGGDSTDNLAQFQANQSQEVFLYTGLCAMRLLERPYVSSRPTKSSHFTRFDLKSHCPLYFIF